MKNKKMIKVILNELARASRMTNKNFSFEISYGIQSYDQSITKLYTIRNNYALICASGRLEEILFFLSVLSCFKDIDLVERIERKAPPIVKSTNTDDDVTF